MKTCIFGFGLLATIVTCLFINAGCITRPTDQQDSFKLEGLDSAAGKVYDTPLIY
jgi:hypothetical protein